ncbi:MAG: hypothetical protein WC670_18640 [Pseudolabrys sp.]|jgi:hypothetical protein
MAQRSWERNKVETSARELVIGEPHHQPGLVAHIPKDRFPIQVINFYHFKDWPREKAYCARCGSHRHRDGFTIELDDGTWALAGSKCAADLWGNEWKSVRSKFDDELRAAAIVLDVRPLVPELKLIRASLNASWRSAIETVSDYQRRFRGAAEPLFNVLKSGAARPDHCITTIGKSSIHLDGWPFFAIEDILERFETALSQIDRAIATGEGQQAELGAHTVSLRQALDHLDSVAQGVRGFRSFFVPKELRDLDNILYAATTRLGSRFAGRYEVKLGQIVDLLTHQPICGPINSYPLLHIEPLRRLQALVS